MTTSGALPQPSPQDRIVDAAIRCLREFGPSGTTIAAIAREAQLSRQTVYSHFGTKEDIVAEAVRCAMITARYRIIAKAARSRTAAGYVVELFGEVLTELRNNPVTSPVELLVDEAGAHQRLITFDPLTFAKPFLEPILEYVPDRAPDLDEMTETLMRFVLSAVVFSTPRVRDPKAMRAYLHRVLVPALGLDPDPGS